MCQVNQADILIGFHTTSPPSYQDLIFQDFNQTEPEFVIALGPSAADQDPVVRFQGRWNIFGSFQRLASQLIGYPQEAIPGRRLSEVPVGRNVSKEKTHRTSP